MKKIILILFGLIGISSYAQDDIYDAPESPKQPSNNTYNEWNNRDENIDYDYNPNYDYQYSRRMRRLYDPYYMMPSSAYFGMNGYPEFNPWYYPWGSGFSVAFGSGFGYGSWNDPWNPYSPWSYGYGGGWNSWYAPHFSSWYSPWESWGYAYNRPGYWISIYSSPYSNGYSGHYGGSHSYHRPTNVPLRQNNIPRPTRYAGSGSYGNTFQRPGYNNNRVNPSPPPRSERVVRQSGGLDFYSTPPAPQPVQNSGSASPGTGNNRSFGGSNSNGGSNHGDGGGIRRGRF